MSYTIVNVIYGVPWTSRLKAALEARDEEDMTSYGFTQLYSADGPSPGYCGASLGEFAAVFESFPLSRLEALRSEVTDAVRARVAALVAQIPPWLAAHREEIDVYVVFSSS